MADMREHLERKAADRAAYRESLKSPTADASKLVDTNPPPAPKAVEPEATSPAEVVDTPGKAPGGAVQPPGQPKAPGGASLVDTGSLGSMAGSAAGMALGGPIGAAIGGAAGSMLGGIVENIFNPPPPTQTIDSATMFAPEQNMFTKSLLDFSRQSAQSLLAIKKDGLEQKKPPNPIGSHY